MSKPLTPAASSCLSSLVRPGRKNAWAGTKWRVEAWYNPVTSKKYGYWTNSALRNTSEEWLAEAQHTPGSWWVHWNNWLGNHAGDLVPARQPGEHGPVIEDAPGSYVRRAS